MIRGLKEAGKKLGLESNPNDEKLSKSCCEEQFDPKVPRGVPMMYRAQIRWRCSLQFAGDNQHLKQWAKEWIRPVSNQQPCYQYAEPQKMGLDGSIYRIKVEFPFRLFSNSGQDSIFRPVLGKNGIPFIPGSGVKGLFLRVCQADDRANNRSQEDSLAKRYCGDADKPGILRFHGAYPIGDWANRMVDVVHPQTSWQVKGRRENSETAFALISLYQPQIIFEFSSADPEFNGSEAETNWQRVRWLLLEALQRGIGGKTSTGYGMGGNFPGQPSVSPRCPISAELNGIGVSSVLRGGEPEFRPNLFKASLRGHIARLLAGVCSSENAIHREVERLFGSTNAEGVVKIFWQSQPSRDEELSHDVRGILYIDAPQREVNFLNQVLQFAFTMGGFGKSWRRVWHKDFYNPIHNKKYSRLIGCHWTSSDFDDIKTRDNLHEFLEALYVSCQNRLGSNPLQSPNWREAWNPNRVAVYSSSNLVKQSSVIELFHNETFKTTPAIGGRNPHREHPKEFNPPSFVSSVWHRMLPVGKDQQGEDQYLEIVTVFHGAYDRHHNPWHREGEDQLPLFIQQLKDRQLKLTWGEPTD
jgi:CRISPR-associated protein Cmr6